MRYQRAEHPLKLDGLGAARSFFAGCLAESRADRESLWVAHLDDDARCLHLSRYPGDEAGADLPIRQILSDALMHRSAGIVLAHNHPSGDPRPSDGDCRATRTLASLAGALDCAIVDHLVFAGEEFTSFRQMGLL